MTSRVFILLLFLGLTQWTGTGRTESLSGDAKVTAARLRVDHERRRAEFEGNVRAEYGTLTLMCDRMTLSYSDSGDVAALSAAGRVVVTRGEARATAETATLRAAEGVLVLEGSPVLTKGAHRLTGKRIRVYLKSGKLDIEDASGSFHFSGKAGP